MATFGSGFHHEATVKSRKAPGGTRYLTRISDLKTEGPALDNDPLSRTVQSLSRARLLNCEFRPLVSRRLRLAELSLFIEAKMH